MCAPAIGADDMVQIGKEWWFPVDDGRTDTDERREVALVERERVLS